MIKALGLAFVLAALHGGDPRGAAPEGVSPVFSSSEVIVLRLEAPVDDLISRFRSEPDYRVRGTLSYTESPGRTVVEAVDVSVRGHTSTQPDECSFPKLKLRFLSKPRPEGSIFGPHSTLKIGTHCGEQPNSHLTAKYGRLANQNATHREVFVYRLLELMGIPTLKARAARITYVAPARSLERDAMVLEDMDDAVRRLGGVREIDSNEFSNARDAFDPPDAAALAFGEALIGNFDWCLRFFPDDRYRCNARHPLWNIAAVVHSDGRRFPLAYDFDVTGMVVGSHPWFPETFNASFAPSKSPAAIEVIAQLQRARSLFERRELNRTRQRFLEQKSAASKLLDETSMDQAGRAGAKAYLTAFFDAIESDQAFYLPVVSRPHAFAYGDAGRASPVCADAGPIPVGTPVSTPRNVRGGMAEVVVLDALWHWTERNRCDEIRKGSVWIERSAISANYP